MSYFEYTDGDTIFEGYLACNGDLQSRRPCVLVGHAWSGSGVHFNVIAEELSQLGFIGFAIDVYGKGVRGKVDGDNTRLMQPLLENRELLLQRLQAAFKVAQLHPLVLPDQVAMIGHCFGGLCALDLARANPAGLKGVVSIHGSLSRPDFHKPQKMDSSVLVLHGWEDPVVPSSDVLEFATEMTLSQADWQIHCYGNAKHAFTFEGAHIPELGIEYNEKAHRRSRRATELFLKEVLVGG